MSRSESLSRVLRVESHQLVSAFLLAVLRSDAEWCNMNHMKQDTSPRIRLTITVSPETHAAYTRLADSTNMSLGRAMGDWLGETSDAAQAAAEIMERAKDAPRDAIRRLNTITATLVAQNEALVDDLMAKDKSAARGGSVSDSHAARRVLTPPSSNTGGKGQRKSSGSVR